MYHGAWGAVGRERKEYSIHTSHFFETYSHCSAARGRGPRDLHGQSTDSLTLVTHTASASVSMNPIRTKSNTKSQLTRQCECPEGRREVCYTCNYTFTESIGIEGVGNRSVWMNEMRIACWKSRNETTCARMGVHENMHENVC